MLKYPSITLCKILLLSDEVKRGGRRGLWGNSIRPPLPDSSTVEGGDPHREAEGKFEYMARIAGIDESRWPRGAREIIRVSEKRTNRSNEFVKLLKDFEVNDIKSGER